MRPTPIRRLLAVVVAMTLLAAACAEDGGESAAADCDVGQTDGDLNLYNWAEYIDPDLVDAFAAEHGIEMTVDVYDSNEAMQPIISAGNSGYDLIVPSDYMVAILIAGEDIQLLNKDAIPNLTNVSADFSDLVYDPAGDYSVPYQWGTTGLAVDTAVVGTDFPRSWSIVFDSSIADQYAGRISLLNDPRETLGAALKYLDDRGIDGKAIEEFQLGYSPKGRDRLKTHLSTLDANLGHAAQAGLLRSDDEGNVRDFFFGRLMVPILNRRGRVAGFGGRSLSGSNPKYINTVATPIFDKQATLYALDKAATAIREQETAIIVEGYMDVIAAHQHDRKNVVASMGTALTERQVYLVRSLAKTVILALDADTAGQEATVRSLEASWRAMDRRRFGQREEVKLLIAEMPEGRDPDDLIRESPDQWDEIVRSAVPYMDYLIPALARRFDVSSSQGKMQAVEALMPIIQSMSNAFDQDRYFGQLASALGVTREQLQASIGKMRPAGRTRTPERARANVPAPNTTESPLAAAEREPLEEFVLSALMRWPDLWKDVGHHSPEEFRRTENRELFTQLLSAGTIDELQHRLDKTLLDHFDYLREIDLKPTNRQTAPRAVRQALTRLEQRYLRERQAELLESHEPGAPLPKDIQDSIVNVNSKLKESYLVGARENPNG